MKTQVDSGNREVCSGCGAPKLSTDDAKCNYCGAVFKVAKKPVQKVIVYKKVKYFDYKIVWFISLVIGVVCIFSVMRSNYKNMRNLALDSTCNIGVFDPIAVFKRLDGGRDILVSTNKKDIVLINGITKKLRWRTEVFSDYPRGDDVLTGDGMAYVIDQTRMVAISLANGKTVWQTPLIAEVSYGKKNSLMLAAGTVLVLEKDGSLQAFDRRTGSPVWNDKFDDRPNSFYRDRNNVVLIHSKNDKSGKQYNVVDIVDAGSGIVKQTLDIKHIDPVFKNYVYPNDRSKFYFSEDGEDLFVIYNSFRDKCVERWHIESGTMVWRNLKEEVGLPSDESYSLGDQAIIISSGHVISSVSLSNGDLKEIVKSKDYTFTPLIVKDGVVVACAKPDWDSDLSELWGLNADNGEKLWTFVLPKKKFHDNYVVHWTGYGLAVVQVISPKQIAMDLLDIKTGVSPGRKVVTINKDDEPSELCILEDGEQAWFRVQGESYSIDLSSGKLAYHFK